MSDDLWIDEILDSFTDCVTKIMKDNQCDLIVPFSKLWLKLLHENLFHEFCTFSFLTEDNINRSNHPLYFADYQKECSEMLESYHFNVQHGTVILGNATKESIIDGWDSEVVGVEVLDYFQDFEEDDILFLVLSYNSDEKQMIRRQKL